MEKAIIFFTRVPILGETKTRLFNFVSPQQACDIQTKLIKNIYSVLRESKEDIFVFYTPEKHKEKLREIINDDVAFIPQTEGDLGVRMSSAIKNVLERGYQSVILMGSDLYELDLSRIEKAFQGLQNNDIIINPSFDGGYTIIGMKENHSEIFDIDTYGNKSVYAKTLLKIKDLGLTVYELDPMQDIDTKEDLITSYLNVDHIELIGAGEYNINYAYHNENKKKVLRINTGSQMHLDNQIAYEYGALKILEKSGVTPKAFYYDNKQELIPYGMLEMEFLEGRALNYYTDMYIAAYLLSQIHALEIPEEHGLIIAQKPFESMYDECSTMASHYLTWEQRSEEVAKYIEYFLKKSLELGINEEITSKSIINTELNSGNFLINKSQYDSYIIDWEKPLIGEKEQDIAHFLAPTTTFWKTDVILTETQIEDFLVEYEKYIDVNREKFKKYLIFTCLRGITWSSMAFVEYESRHRVIKNEFTYNKIKNYLSIEFLEMIKKYFE